MRLYHFSNKELKVLKPDFFGENSFTKNDTKFPCKRFFCYADAKPKEYCFAHANFRYSIKIKDKLIYNLDADVLNLKERFDFNIDKILAFVSKKYHAIEYSTSFKTYAIFKPYAIFTSEKHELGKQWEA